jgi:hypothetical protein
LLEYITDKSPNPLLTSAPNQPPDAAERTTRHLALCAELADLAMELARLAAARTLASWAEPEEPPQIAAAPCTKTPAPPPDHEALPPATPARISCHRPTDPALLFTRLAATVRDCIALEARLAAAAAGTRNIFMRRSDPRRAPLRQALCLATQNHPGHAELRHEATTLLDAELAADPDQTIDPADLLAAICDDLGITIDFAALPDEYLFASTGTPNQDKDTPDPRATSPP